MRQAEVDLQEAFRQRILRGIIRRLNNSRITKFAHRVAAAAPDSSGKPVVFFKASTGIDDLSWNSGFHLLASWALRLRGVPVVYFACRSGMSRCVLGTNRDRVLAAPPCKSCIHQSKALYSGVQNVDGSGLGNQARSEVRWFDFRRDTGLAQVLESLRLGELMEFVWPLPDAQVPAPKTIPLGALCLPGLRWILRRHNLADDDDTCFLLREYILSAWSVARQFSSLLDAVKPRVVVVFNGQFFPEAVARFLAARRGIRVVTHEVGLEAASAFFTDGEATAYPMRIPEGFELTARQDARLDDYLQRRFQGKFTMAGIQFWPDMRGLDEDLLQRASGFRQLVPIFTNVIFDTSQPHANTVFPDMFAWLELVLAEIKSHPDSLFVIRAHPDETRVRKESRETVQDWVERSGASHLENVVFVGPKEYLSSYELIQRSKFVMVYNSTIGLEASIMGRPVLCGGRARFTQYPTVFFPGTIVEQRAMLRQFLEAPTIEVPREFQVNARRFLYVQLFRASLPLGEFLEASVRKTQSRLKKFELHDLTGAPALRVIVNGILDGGDFVLTEDDSREEPAS